MSQLINYDNTGVQVVSPTPTGAGGLALNSNFQLLAYYRRVFPTTVIVQSFTITSIAANTTAVQNIPLGTLKNSVQAIVGFFTSSATNIGNLNIDASGFPTSSVKITPRPDGNNAATILPVLLSPNFSQRMIVVTADPTQAARCFPAMVQGEAVGGGVPGTPLSAYGYTYAAINSGALFGYYYGGTTGVLGFTKKVALQSAWLTTASGNSTLNVAFNNYDSTATSSLSLQVAVFQ